MSIKHPMLPILVREDGYIRLKKGYTLGSDSKKNLGYKIITVVDFHKKKYQVHRLVAECFIPNPENKPTVDHINRNPNDNRATNLRWATQKEQIANSAPVLFKKGRNLEKARITNRRSYLKNGKAWREKNKEKLLQQQRIRRVNKKGHPGDQPWVTCIVKN